MLSTNSKPFVTVALTIENKDASLITNPIGLGPFGWLTNGVDLTTRFMPECDYEVICKYSGKFLTSLNHSDLASLNFFGIVSFGILYSYYLNI